METIREKQNHSAMRGSLVPTELNKYENTHQSTFYRRRSSIGNAGAHLAKKLNDPFMTSYKASFDRGR
jgi:hypothetical protein